IQLTIKTADSKTFIIIIDALSHVSALKDKIKDETNVPAAQQRLLHAGMELTEERPLSDYGIKGKTTILL
ncbi:ubiquitin, partial [Serendipita vermifera]